MSRLLLTLPLGALSLFVALHTLSAEDGFTALFDGKTLDGWDGDPKFWRVEEGAIVGETTPQNPTKGNTFLIWEGGEVADFEMKVEFKLRNHNSGIQYRGTSQPDLGLDV
ncbi:MAG: 3-keto-disaccharide hydrolase, partial [Coraliomargarita sp.]